MWIQSSYKRQNSGSHGETDSTLHKDLDYGSHLQKSFMIKAS